MGNFFVSIVAGAFVIDGLDDLANQEGANGRCLEFPSSASVVSAGHHVSTHADDDVFRSSKEPVQDGTGERGVKSIRGSELSQESIRHSLRDHYKPDGDAFRFCQR